MKKFLIIVAGIVTSFLLIMGGCAVLVGGAVSSVDAELDKQQSKNAITNADFRGLKAGTSLSDVKAQFGKPADQQVFKSGGLKDVTIYYNVKGGDLMDQFQLTFTNGKLDSKARW